MSATWWLTFQTLLLCFGGASAITGQTAFTVSVQIPNATTSGTVLNQLACWNGSAGQSAAINCTTMSTTNFIGVVIGNPGTSGNAVVVESGPTPCLFDSTTPTANDYVVASTTSGMGGRCSDAGSTYPTMQFVNSAGTALSPVSFVYNQTSETAISYPLTATDQGAYWNNAGAMAGVVLGLPSPTQGSVYYFTVIAALPLTVKAPAGIQICYTQAGASSPTCSVTGGTIASNVPGSFLKVYATNSVWYVEYETGTWVGPT